MILRPVDADGDILPVLSSGDLLRGASAAGALVRDRLELTAGDWWENPALGNAATDMLKGSRLTEADGRALAAYLVGYIRRMPGVQEVRDAGFSAEGGRFRFTCTVGTAEGDAEIRYGV